MSYQKGHPFWAEPSTAGLSHGEPATTDVTQRSEMYVFMLEVDYKCFCPCPTLRL